MQRIEQNSHGTFIFCGWKTQFMALLNWESFEVDMSFKRVKGAFNEVIFATFIEEHGKGMLSKN